MLTAIGRRMPWGLLGDSKGVASLEYAVLALGIVLAILAAVASVGTTVAGMLASVNTSV